MFATFSDHSNGAALQVKRKAWRQQVSYTRGCQPAWLKTRSSSGCRLPLHQCKAVQCAWPAHPCLARYSLCCGVVVLVSAISAVQLLYESQLPTRSCPQNCCCSLSLPEQEVAVGEEAVDPSTNRSSPHLVQHCLPIGAGTKEGVERQLHLHHAQHVADVPRGCVAARRKGSEQVSKRRVMVLPDHMRRARTETTRRPRGCSQTGTAQLEHVRNAAGGQQNGHSLDLDAHVASRQRHIAAQNDQLALAAAQLASLALAPCVDGDPRCCAIRLPCK